MNRRQLPSCDFPSLCFKLKLCVFVTSIKPRSLLRGGLKEASSIYILVYLILFQPWAFHVWFNFYEELPPGKAIRFELRHFAESKVGAVFTRFNKHEPKVYELELYLTGTCVSTYSFRAEIHLLNEWTCCSLRELFLRQQKSALNFTPPSTAIIINFIHHEIQIFTLHSNTLFTFAVLLIQKCFFSKTQTASHSINFDYTACDVP